MIYVVRPGDTMAEIASRFRIPLATLIQLNPDIDNINEIYVGQQIIIPDEVEPEAPEPEEPEPIPIRPTVTQYAIRKINNLLLIAFANKGNYRQGETVKLYLVKVNIGGTSLSLHYSNAQRIDFTAVANNLRWTWSRGRSFAFQQADIVIEPNECKVFTANWNQQSNNGRQMSGNVEITGWNVENRFENDRLSFSINIR